MAFDFLQSMPGDNLFTALYPDAKEAQKAHKIRREWIDLPLSKYNIKMQAVEKDLAKAFLRLSIEEEAPRKGDKWILTSPVDMSHYLNVTHISRWHNPAPMWLNWANQAESDVPLVFNMRLFEAFKSSKSWLEDEREQRKRKWAIPEIERVGDTPHFSEMTLACRRFRVYDRKRAWSHQGDKLEKSLVWFAEPLPLSPIRFYNLVKGEGGGIHKYNYKDILNYGSHMGDAYDRFGPKLLALALACEEFEATSMSSYGFAFDQSGSGPAFQAFWEKHFPQLIQGNFLGHRRGDIYGEVATWLYTMDTHLRKFDKKDLRDTAKCLARGGNYEGGAPVGAYHILDLAPDNMDRLDAGDRLFLEDHVEFPECFWHHPDFVPLFKGHKLSGEPILRSNIVFKDIFEVSHSWCRKVGMEALHNGIQTIRPHAKRLRDGAKECLSETGKMLSWECPLGGIVYKIPYKRDTMHTHNISVSYNGFKGKATISNSEYKEEQNISADFDHTCDAIARGVTVLLCDQKDIPVLTNHDAFKIHGANAHRINSIHRNAVALGLRGMELPPYCKEPKGKSYDEILDEISQARNDTLFP